MKFPSLLIYKLNSITIICLLQSQMIISAEMNTASCYSNTHFS